MVVNPNAPFEARRAAGAMLVEECDVPAEMTLQQWRRQAAEERRAARDEARTTTRLAARVRAALQRR